MRGVVSAQPAARQASLLFPALLTTRSTTRTLASSSSSSSSSPPSEPRVVVEPDGNNPSVVHVRLNRPRKLNAVDLRMFESIRDALDELKRRTTNAAAATTPTTASGRWTSLTAPSVRAVILSGNGRAFCSGLDVPSLFSSSASSRDGASEKQGIKLPGIGNPLAAANALLSRRRRQKTARGSREEEVEEACAEVEEAANLAQSVAYGWRELGVPVIAVLHGPCFGAGLQIALGADVRICADDAQLSVMEGKWGLVPDMSASVTLRELVRIDVAKELTYTGRVVGAREAAEIGLVTNVAETRELAMEKAVELANLISNRSPDAVALAKRLYQETWTNPSDRDCLRLESDFQRKLIATWNQVAASSRNFGWKIPYF